MPSCAVSTFSFSAKFLQKGNHVILGQGRVNRMHISFNIFFIFSKLSFILAPLFLCFSVFPINKDLSIVFINLVHMRGLLNKLLPCRGRENKFLKDFWNVRMSAKSQRICWGLTAVLTVFSDKTCCRGISLLET